MFSRDDQLHEDMMDDNRRGGGNGLIFLLVLLGVLFLPSAIVGYLVYSLLRYFRQRVSVVSMVSILALLSLYGWWAIADYTETMREYFSLTSFSDVPLLWDNISYLFGPLVIMYLAVGVLGGWLGAAVMAFQLRTNQTLRKFTGRWTHNFEYRRSPFEIIRRRKLIAGLKSGKYRGDQEAPLGLDESVDDIVYRHSDESTQHELITGGTGSGKTVTMLSMIKQNIEAGIPAIIIDLKRSPDMAAKLALWTKQNGGKFHHFVNGSEESYDIPHSSGQSFYDPLRTGSNTSKADMLLGMREYDTAAAVYKTSMQQLLQILMLMISTVKEKRKQGEDICPGIDWDSGGVYEIASAIKTENFIEMLNECAQMEDNPRVSNDAKEVHQILSSSKNSNLAHAMGSLQGQMRTIISSEYGEWMKTEKEGNNIDLYEASTTPGSVVLFSLNSDDEKEFARFVGSIIMSDITRVSATRRNRGDTSLVNIYIDEFQVLVPDSVTDLLEKARASAIGVTLAQQSLSQVMKSVNNGEAYLQSILDTVSNFVFHAGSGYETAERMSKILGKERVEVLSMSRRQDKFLWSINWSKNRQAMVRSSFEDRWVIDPSEFMNLKSPARSNNYKSEAIVIKKASVDDSFVSDTGGAGAKKVWMIPESEILEKHYEPSNSETQRIFNERHRELDDDELLAEASASRFGADSLATELQQHLSGDGNNSQHGTEDDEDMFAMNTEVSLLDLRRNDRANEEQQKNPSMENDDIQSSSGDDDGFTQLSDDELDDNDDWSIDTLLSEEPVQEKPKRQPRKSTSKSNQKNRGLPRQLPEEKDESSSQKNGLPSLPDF